MSDEMRLRAGKNGLDYYRDNFDRTMLLERLEEWMKQFVTAQQEGTST
jgi:hypothetical protein